MKLMWGRGLNMNEGQLHLVDLNADGEIQSVCGALKHISVVNDDPPLTSEHVCWRCVGMVMRPFGIDASRFLAWAWPEEAK